MDEIKAKQQVVEKIKESSKILVTVSDSPSVDALSAALALTMILDKQEKYATAIFSGETPPAIAFLEPQKTFDDTTDSLRDFIIALNKEKADHLRYKVEGDSVKIFITPYKTTIDQKDLEFSQGDYNVELVIALGVDDQKHLDKALEDHGQILHDAAIITLTAGEQVSDLGGIDWHDANASSLSEMIAGLGEALKEDKKKSLLDEQIATALLTGIVAETDRFSNEHTTSKVMTVAATLMSAGADQQLIATELQASREIKSTPVEEPAEASRNEDVEVDKESADGSLTIKKHEDTSSLSIEHKGETLAELDRRILGDEEAREKVIEEVAVAQEKAAQEEAREEADVQILQEQSQVHAGYAAEEEVPQLPAIEPAMTETTNEIQYEELAPSTPAARSAYAADESEVEPILGGTLNATAEQAAEDARREAENDQNRTILSHAYLGGADAASAGGAETGFPGTPQTAPGSVGVNDYSENEEVHAAYAPAASEYGQAPGSPTIAVGAERVIQPLSSQIMPEPVAAPAPAYAAEAPLPPINPSPTDLGLPLPPPIPDFSQTTASTAGIPLPPTPQSGILGDILAPEPPVVPDYTSNAVPAENTAYAPEPTLPPVDPVPQQPASNDPAQFQIPPQQ
jgi:hypothetical protein